MPASWNDDQEYVEDGRILGGINLHSMRPAGYAYVGDYWKSKDRKKLVKFTEEDYPGWDEDKHCNKWYSEAMKWVEKHAGSHG